MPPLTGIGSGAEQRLKQPTPFQGCSWAPQQGISPLQLGKLADSPSGKPSGGADGQPSCPSSLRSWVLTISHFKPFPFPGSSKSLGLQSPKPLLIFWLWGWKRPLPSFTHSVFLGFPGQSWARGPGAFLFG